MFFKIKAQKSSYEDAIHFLNSMQSLFIVRTISLLIKIMRHFSKVLY